MRRPDPRFPRWLAILGAATVVAFIAFLIAFYGYETLGAAATRPAVSIVATLEWAVIIGIMAWAFGVAFSWWRADREDDRTC